MPANLRVLTGLSAGALFWIERPVIRIGSDPACDVCLPSVALAKHAVTLEFRDGQYLVHNRARQPIGLDGRDLPADGKAPWRGGQSLRLSDDAELQLEIDGDPSPSPKPADLGGEDYDQDPEEQSLADESAGGSREPAEAAKTVFQLAVIAFCVIGSVVLLIYDARKTEAVATFDVPPFAQIVEQGLADPQGGPLLSRLQMAEAAMVRDDQDLARTRFAALRDDLVPRQGPAHAPSPPKERSDFVENAYQHVLLRLSELN